MSKEATKEYVGRMRQRYAGMKTRAAKGMILDDFCQTSWYERKHAIKLLNGKAGTRRNRPGRKKRYGSEAKEVLKSIWLMSDQLCSKLLKPVAGLYLGSYEKHVVVVADEVREQLLNMSAATMDRLLKDQRVGTAKWRRRVSLRNTRIKQLVPVRMGPWDVNEPGWVEADGVAHCGGSMAGNFIWSLTYKDIFSGWTEARAVWNRSGVEVKNHTSRLRETLPFDILGLDVDNGPEFLNWTLYRFCTKGKDKIRMTRSRAYQKNDNAHVEQRNWTHVRQLLGYDRLEDPDMVDLINDLYANEWSQFKNLYCPTMKLISKERDGSRYIKRFDNPQTPCQRLLESEAVGLLQKQHLRRLLETTDPYLLHQGIHKKLERIFSHAGLKLQKRAS